MSAEVFREFQPDASALLEIANAHHERREHSRALNRFAEYTPFCSVPGGCGRVEQESDAEFEERIEGHICPDCIDREMETDGN